MSFMPGTAVATTSSAPDAASRREMRRRPWSSRYSTSAWSGVSVRARNPGRSVASSYASGGPRKHAASPDLPSTSTISTLMPVRTAAVASAAVTVVFPTPPLPATITTLEAAQKRSRSMVHDATGAPAARLLRRALALLALTVAVTSLWLDHAGALPPVGKRGIDVVQVEGLFDPSNQSL